MKNIIYRGAKGKKFSLLEHLQIKHNYIHEMVLCDLYNHYTSLLNLNNICEQFLLKKIIIFHYAS